MPDSAIKITINLNKYYKEQLDYFVKIDEIDSVTEGINIAIEQFVKEKQKELYEKEMKEAKSDSDFIKRTMGTHIEFEKSDLEIEKINSMEDFQ